MRRSLRGIVISSSINGTSFRNVPRCCCLISSQRKSRRRSGPDINRCQLNMRLQASCSDIVEFTPMAATMTPLHLVDLLNEVFQCFDDLVEKYGLEKIKTIGDCYMVAAGVPRSSPNHARLIVNLALDMQAAAAERKFGDRELSFRIGINSGQVVAGVIGRKKFIYDLWGDAVNVASRMESHGQSRSIQITRNTYQLIKDEFVCEAKGTIDVKGIDQLETWHVLGKKAA